MAFDHRSVTRATKHDWGHGRGSLHISMESSVVVRDPVYLDSVIITLGLHDWAKRITPDQQQQQLQQPNYYKDEITPPLRQRWIDHISELTVPERSFMWPELVARLRSFPRIPPPALGFFLQFMNRELGDAARKAVFLEHRSMAVSLDISITTDMPPERLCRQLPPTPGREAVCDHGEQSKGRCGESKCWGCGADAGGFAPRSNGNGKEEGVANMCKLSL